ncbi:MAG: hypothetical protein ACYDCO_19265 [Armatimonadota bacterium]
MTTEKWTELAQEYLLPNLPGFTLFREWLLLAPIGWQVRGFCFSTAKWDHNTFTIEACVLPLYVPQFIGLTFGERLGVLAAHRGSLWWSFNSRNKREMSCDILYRIRRNGLPYLEKRATLEAMTRLNHMDYPDERYIQRAMMCAGVLLDDRRVIERQWKAYQQRKQQTPESALTEWEKQLHHSIEKIYASAQSDPATMRQVISSWRKLRAEEYRLERYLADEPCDLRDRAMAKSSWW